MTPWRLVQCKKRSNTIIHIKNSVRLLKHVDIIDVFSYVLWTILLLWSKYLYKDLLIFRNNIIHVYLSMFVCPSNLLSFALWTKLSLFEYLINNSRWMHWLQRMKLEKHLKFLIWTVCNWIYRLNYENFFRNIWRNSVYCSWSTNNPHPLIFILG